MGSKQVEENSGGIIYKSLPLGAEARDKITGFRGIITAVVYHLYGCTQYGLVPKVGGDNKIKNAEWFDEGRVEQLADGIAPADVAGLKPGGGSPPSSNKMSEPPLR